MVRPPCTEFYDGNNQHHFIRVDGAPAFAIGHYVNICKANWKVVGISWSVDHFDEPDQQLRQNVILEKVK